MKAHVNNILCKVYACTSASGLAGNRPDACLQTITMFSSYAQRIIIYSVTWTDSIVQGIYRIQYKLRAQSRVARSFVTGRLSIRDYNRPFKKVWWTDRLHMLLDTHRLLVRDNFSLLWTHRKWLITTCAIEARDGRKSKANAYAYSYPVILKSNACLVSCLASCLLLELRNPWVYIRVILQLPISVKFLRSLLYSGVHII